MKKEEAESAEGSIAAKNRLVQQLVRSVTEGGAPGCALCGPPGNGKSTQATLSAGKYHYVKAPMSAPFLDQLKFAYDNRAKGTIILWDDIATSNKPAILALHKAMLGGDPKTGKRSVRVSSPVARNKPYSLPEVFDFEAGIIQVFNHNELPDDIHTAAIMSRIPALRYELTFPELIFQMSEMAKDHVSLGLSEDQSKECIAFIEEHAHPGCRNFDLRILKKIAAIIKGSPSDWKLLAAKLLDADPIYYLMKDLQDFCNSLEHGDFKVPVEKRIEVFRQRTGLGRSSYFNYFKRFEFDHPGDIIFTESDKVALIEAGEKRAKKKSKNPADSVPQEAASGVPASNNGEPAKVPTAESEPQTAKPIDNSGVSNDPGVKPQKNPRGRPPGRKNAVIKEASDAIAPSAKETSNKPNNETQAQA